MMKTEASPLRKQHPEDSVDRIEVQESAGAEDDPFDIPPKGASIERVRRWRRLASVLNASRGFRSTLDLKKEKQKEELRRKIRANLNVTKAAFRFYEAGRTRDPLPLLLEKAGIRPVPKTELPVVMPRDYGIREEQLMAMTREFNKNALEDYGGVEGVANLLKTNVDRGITEDDADLISRHNAFGSNTYYKKEKGFWSFLWEASQYLPLIILMVAAALSLGFGIKTEGFKEGWYDGGSIAFAVCLVIVVTAISDYKQSLQFRHLVIDESSIDESTIEVIRNSKRMSKSIFDLVVGDVVPLKIDDKVPADGLLIRGESLVIDESSIRGGSELVYKDQKSPFLMAGCTVVNGDGIMLVTAIGMNTTWGSKYMATKRDYNEETPLQVRQDIVATKIETVGLAVAGAVLVVLLARYFTGKTTNADGTMQYIKGKTSVMSAIHGVIKFFTVAVTIVVVAVPKGLPSVLSLTLAYSMRKMKEDKGLVRRLSAWETVGLATTICIDKIGTLTLNQMTVVEAYVGEKNIAGASNVGSLSPTVNSLLLEGIAQNCTGSVHETENAAVQITGSPTEKAILGWGVELKMRFNEVRSKSVIIHASPFNSEKKRGGVAVHVGGSDVHVHWKGAAEIVLDLCTSWMDASGTKHDMRTHAVERFQKQIEAMAAKSLRCVALAYKPFDLKEVPNEDQRVNWSLPDDDLILLAIVGMKEPCHPGVKDAVLLCTNAGVKIRMVTGDNLQTAKDIALECGILSENDKIDEVIVEGEVFRALNEDQKEQMVDKIKVMAKSSPIDKLQLVNALKERGHVVAVTGYDTNDVPALYEADIGLAMGIQGTEVAKVSSDIIILDDNFSSIVKLVRWGRSVYANIQKFIQFQLTVNVAALFIIMVAAVSSGNVPLNAVQLLWVNLIMDTLGALALASEPPSDSLMKRAPVGRREPLITNIMWRNLLIQAFFQVAILLTLNIKGRSLLQLENHSAAKANEIKNTFIFNTFVLCQVFNEFNARKPEEFNIFEGVTKNHLFVGIIGVTIVLQAMIIEFLGKFTSTVKLSWQLWLVSIGIAFVSWPLAFLGKFIPVPQTPLKKLICTCLTNRRKAQRDEAGNSSLV